MFRYFRIFFADISKLLKKYWKTGWHVWIYFENVNDAFEMEIGNVMDSHFTARFVNEENYEKSNVDKDFGQIDNDIIFDKNTLNPIFKFKR